MKMLLAAVAAVSLLAAPALAADMPVKVSPSNRMAMAGYPTGCGVYFGLGTGGSAGSVDGAAVGTQIVQGDLNAIVGYTCPFRASSFWFVEASIGYSNLNGSVNGLAMTGPLISMQRAGIGSPINEYLGSFFSTPAMPSLPALPNGVTAGPANGYLFAGIVEQDVTAQLNVIPGHTKQWVIAPLVGVGLLTRLSDGVVIDTWAGWQLNSQSFCPGAGTTGCAKLGNAGRVGVSFKY